MIHDLNENSQSTLHHKNYCSMGSAHLTQHDTLCGDACAACAVMCGWCMHRFSACRGMFGDAIPGGVAPRSCMSICLCVIHLSQLLRQPTGRCRTSHSYMLAARRAGRMSSTGVAISAVAEPASKPRSLSHPVAMAIRTVFLTLASPHHPEPDACRACTPSGLQMIPQPDACLHTLINHTDE